MGETRPMPRRTGKLNPADMEKIMATDPKEEHIDQQEEQEESAKNMLELSDLSNLIFLGSLKETLDISGYKFLVRTLSASQQRELMAKVMESDQVDRLLDIKPITISYALESVNSVPLESLCKDDSITDPYDRRMNVIMQLQSSIHERIYKAFESLTTTSNEAVGLEDVKK
jgi:hypothetical protein